MKAKLLRLIFFILLLSIVNIAIERKGIQLTLSSNSLQTGKVQVFWDIGFGFSERLSKTKNIQPGHNKLWFNMPFSPFVKSVRFDIFESKNNTFVIHDVLLIHRNDVASVFDIKEAQIEQINNIRANQFVTTGSDPKIIFNNIQAIFFFNKYFIVSAVLSFFIIFFFKYNAHLKSLFIRLNISLSRIFQPLLRKFSNIKNNNFFYIFTILLICLVSVYPIFLGKSYDSPASQALLSSPGSINPTIPGISIEESSAAERFYGNDTGAYAWQTAPNLVAGMDSIINDGEFPFFNRFIGGGTPNFAQNVNSLLDPLNIFIILFSGDSWGFDLKFIFSKIIFIFGIFLLLNCFLREKNISFFVSIATIFLGYFHYRVIHPAINVLTYLPWLILLWVWVYQFFEKEAKETIKLLSYLSLIVILNFLVIQSGPLKETLIAMLIINLYGSSLLLFYTKNKIYKLPMIFLIGMAIVFVCSFNLLPFYNLLIESGSNYSDPSVNQRPLIYILGLFQKKLMFHEAGAITNIFFFVAIISFLTFFKDSIKDSVVRLAFIFFVICFCIVYTIFPAVVLIKIPFINNIHHLWDTFGVPMILFLIIMSAKSLEVFLTKDFDHKLKVLKISFIAYFLLSLIYLFFVRTYEPELNIFDSILVIFGTLLYLIWLIFKVNSNDSLIKYLLLFFVIHFFINTFHLKPTKLLDSFLTQPLPRGDYKISSKAIEFIKDYQINNDSPLRVIGFFNTEDSSTTLFPGFNTRLSIESFVQVDPMYNKHFKNVLDLGGLKNHNDWNWLRLLDENNISQTIPMLEKQNNLFIFTHNNVDLAKFNVHLAHKSDYSVWYLENAWPRAFVTNKLNRYNSDHELKSFLNQKASPNISLQKETHVKKLNTASDKYHNNAYNYNLTNNSLSFNVNVQNLNDFVVINNTYWEKDYKLYVNGQKAQYGLANGSNIYFQAEKIGINKVKLEYYPKFAYETSRLTVSILLLCFITVLLSACKNFIKFKQKKRIS